MKHFSYGHTMQYVRYIFQFFFFWVKKIIRRSNAHLLKYPDAKVISLGIGDTTEPIPEVISSAMAKVKKKAHHLSDAVSPSLF